MNTTPNQNFYSFTYFDRLKMRSTRTGTARNRKLSRPSSLENYSRKQKHNLRLIWLEIISTYQEKGQKRRQWVDQVLSEVIPLIDTFRGVKWRTIDPQARGVLVHGRTEQRKERIDEEFNWYRTLTFCLCVLFVKE